MVGTYTTEQAVQPPLGPRVIFWKGKELVPAEVDYIEKNWLNKKDKNDKFTGHYESYGDYDQYNAEYYDNQYYDQMEYLIERAYERGFKKGYISGSDKHRKSSKMIKRLRH